MSTLLLSVWAEWLLAHLNKSFITIGTAFENREDSESKYILDLLVSIFPLVISNTSIESLKQQLEHAKLISHVPYEQLAETESFLHVRSWFDCFYGFHHWPKPEFNINGLDWSICTFTQGISRYPLSLDVFILGKRGMFKLEKSINLSGLKVESICVQLLEILEKKVNA